MRPGPWWWVCWHSHKHEALNKDPPKEGVGCPLLSAVEDTFMDITNISESVAAPVAAKEAACCMPRSLSSSRVTFGG